ncbi:MAG TPA: class I SAM-dependent methyltransferase [Anaerolineales bacterium]|nr:class I SAM-dependent methyltransferase [Anaerolineales bacterium]
MTRILGRHKHNWFSHLFIIAILAGLWRVFERRSQERIPSPEGIEDPEIANAFEWVSRTPQMHWIRHFVISQAVALQEHGEAVDLGCGAGQLVLELAQKGSGLHITGIDLSEKMLTDAKQSARLAGLEDRVDFRLGNVEEIPFPDQSLDLVISTASLHHWTHPVKVFNEIERVLKPGGAFYIFDLRRDVALPFYMLIWFATQFVVPAALHRVNEPMGSRNASYTIKELEDLIRQSRLLNGQVTTGPLWIVLAGKKRVT